MLLLHEPTRHAQRSRTLAPASPIKWPQPVGGDNQSRVASSVPRIGKREARCGWSCVTRARDAWSGAVRLYPYDLNPGLTP
jgi:hypothetical protein